jgi:hypothetical protein
MPMATEAPTRPALRHRFLAAIISYAVWRLGLRDVELLLSE